MGMCMCVYDSFFVCILSHSVVSNYYDPKHCSLPGSSVHEGFSRQEYWSGLPFPSPGDLPDPEIKPRSPALQEDSLLTELRGQFLYKNQILEPPEEVTETALGIALGLAVTHLSWFLHAFGKHHIVQKSI